MKGLDHSCTRDKRIKAQFNSFIPVISCTIQLSVVQRMTVVQRITIVQLITIVQRITVVQRITGINELRVKRSKTV